MKNLLRAGALALALLCAAEVAAQIASSARAPAGFAPVQAPCVVQADESCVPVSAANPLLAASPRRDFTALAKDVALDLRSYAGADMQIAGLSGGDSVTVSVSADGTNWTVQTVLGRDYATATTVTAPGIFSFPAAAFVKWSQTGTASTPTALIRAQ